MTIWKAGSFKADGAAFLMLVNDSWGTACFDKRMMIPTPRVRR